MFLSNTLNFARRGRGAERESEAADEDECPLDSDSAQQDAAQLDAETYDRSAPTRHEYLPERTHAREAHVLHAKEVYDLPMMWLWEKQLHPHQQLPILLQRQAGPAGCCEPTRQAIAKAIQAPRPYTGYVACGIESSDPRCKDSSKTHVCVAFICETTVDEGSLLTPSGIKKIPNAVVLKGCYRAQCIQLTYPPRGAMRMRATTATVRIEADHTCEPMPRAFVRNECFWSAAEARMFDASAVLRDVLDLHLQVMPTVEVPGGFDIERLSFWFLQTLPLSSGEQHELFCKPALQRLQGIHKILAAWQQRAQFTCHNCRQPIAAVRNSLPMSDLGPSGTFVNAYGYMHTVTCVSEVQPGSVQCMGSPTQQFSWFPKYAWTAAFCHCGESVGWRFTRVSGKGPESFWGLTQNTLQVSDMHADDGVS